MAYMDMAYIGMTWIELEHCLELKLVVRLKSEVIGLGDKQHHQPPYLHNVS